MQDKSLFSSQPLSISKGLQNFIDSMVEEIVLEGKPFNTQKKYLKKFSEKEGLDYEQLESNICTFIDIFENIKKTPNKLMEKFAIEKGHDCYISAHMVKHLLSHLPQNERYLISDTKTGLFGYIDFYGNVVIEPQFIGASERFSDGLASVIKGKKWGFINCDGEEVVPPVYEYVGSFAEGMAVVKRSSKFGFIDRTGKEVVPRRYKSEYNFSGRFSEGLALVIQIEKYSLKFGYVDKTGTEVIPCTYSWASSFSDGLAAVRLADGRLAMIDTKGKVAFDLKYDELGYRSAAYSNGMLSVARETSFGTKWGFIDKEGNEIVPCKYDEARDFCEGMALVQLNGKMGFVDKKGKDVIPPIWTSAEDFSEGLACVSTDDWKHGFVDKKGNLVVPCIYDEASSFSDGLATVQLNGKVGFIDRTGKTVLPCKFDPVYHDIEHTAWTTPSFDRGLAMISVDDKKAYINKEGHVVWIEK